MFDRQIALEKAQGFRGPATRLFGPIDTSSEAELVLRETCFVLLVLAAFVAVSGVRFGAELFVVGLVIALPSGLLLISRHRVAAVALLLISAVLTAIMLGLRMARGLPGLAFLILLLLLSVRASRATFKRHLFRTTSPNASAVASASGTPGSGA